jgi:hypothetical protein
MSNWIEEAENKNRPSAGSEVLKGKIRKRKAAVRQNFEANKLAYESFINELRHLVDRVNNLPIEHRREFGKIKLNAKKSKLDNGLYYITSSRSVKKRIFISLTSLFNKSDFKNIRAGYFTISRHEGMTDVEIKENLLLKVRMKSNSGNERVMKLKKKDWGRRNKLFRMNMERLNNDLAMEIIDWIAFKREMEEISFFTEERD